MRKLGIENKKHYNELFSRNRLANSNCSYEISPPLFKALNMALFQLKVRKIKQSNVTAKLIQEKRSDFRFPSGSYNLASFFGKFLQQISSSLVVEK